MIRIQRSPEPKVITKNKKRWREAYLEAAIAFTAQKTVIVQPPSHKGTKNVFEI